MVRVFVRLVLCSVLTTVMLSGALVAAQNVDGVYAECTFEFLADDQFTSDEKQACLKTLTRAIMRAAFGGISVPAGGSVTPDPPDHKSCGEREACRVWDECVNLAAGNCHAEHETHLDDPDNPHNITS